VAGLATAAVAAADSPPVTGDVQTYRVRNGDTLALVAARFGIEPPLLARDNGLVATARLHPGDELEIDNRHIVPASMQDGIVINLPQRRLFLFRGGSLADSYPIAVGSTGWRTPTGEFTIQNMEVDPTWDVPKSIQAEMAAKGKRVLTRVPPGPDNPLGTRWIALTSSIGIHGTNAPSSIFKYSTHGCVRMAIEDVEDLFGKVSKGLPVSIIYQPLLVAKHDNDVFVEVHRDPYGRGGASRADLEQALAAIGASDMAAHPQVDSVLKMKEGRAVSLKELTAASAGQR
jgi:L,D-transpeptidase ErfK/SrfK